MNVKKGSRNFKGKPKKGYKDSGSPASSEDGARGAVAGRGSKRGSRKRIKRSVSSFNKDEKPDNYRNKRFKNESVRRDESKTKQPAPKNDGLTRLNKFLANGGICSRREADELIKAGLVKVNGKIITELGSKVSPDDEVRYNDERIQNQNKVYLILNKPKDYITSVSDEQNRRTVMDLVANACKERIYPVGRLDRNTTGLLLLTNDGDIAKRLTHPKHEKKKIYLVTLNSNLKSSDLDKIRNGIELEDGFIKPDEVNYASTENKKEIGIEIHSGKNRIVRRIFESLDYNVTKLDRVYFAGLTKKNLPRGKWRFLNEKEIVMLKMNAFE